MQKFWRKVKIGNMCISVIKSKQKFLKGFVCYIDLLGFSSLTSKNDKKANDEIKFKLLTFHSIIKKQITQQFFYSIISDSVFICSTGFDKIFLCALSNIFRQCLKNGILLRAGLDFGDFYILKTKLSSHNIFGKAVSNAVSLEEKGKGCRIFIDENFPSSCKSLTRYQDILFHQYKNYQDFSYIDVFEWPYINENYIYNATEKDFLRNPNNNLRKLLFSNSELLILLRFSKLFKKNIADKNGVQQIKSTVEYISSLSEKILKALKCNVTEEIDIEYLNLQSNTCTLELDNLIEKKKNLYMKGEYLSCNEI